MVSDLRNVASLYGLDLTVAINAIVNLVAKARAVESADADGALDDEMMRELREALVPFGEPGDEVADEAGGAETSQSALAAGAEQYGIAYKAGKVTGELATYFDELFREALAEPKAGEA